MPPTVACVARSKSLAREDTANLTLYNDTSSVVSIPPAAADISENSGFHADSGSSSSLASSTRSVPSDSLRHSNHVGHYHNCTIKKECIQTLSLVQGATLMNSIVSVLPADQYNLCAKEMVHSFNCNSSNPAAPAANDSLTFTGLLLLQNSSALSDKQYNTTYGHISVYGECTSSCCQWILTLVTHGMAIQDCEQLCQDIEACLLQLDQGRKSTSVVLEPSSHDALPLFHV
jgi:hypothetical protein